MKKYIVTGGPCTGKTSLLKELTKRGYTTLDESARQIIESESFLHSQNKTYEPILPWTDLLGFQKLVITNQINNELNVSSKNLVFLDRSLIDGIAYSRLSGLSIDDFVNPLIETADYTQVFFLDRLNFYINDASRTESKEEAIKVHNKLYETYNETNLEIIQVPNIGIEQRADFIETYINGDSSKQNIPFKDLSYAYIK